MAYNLIPKSIEELNNIHPNGNILADIFKFANSLGIEEPLALDPTNLKSKNPEVKVMRTLADKLNDSDLKKYGGGVFNLKFGNGSRGNGGSNNRGLLYEKDLFNDIKAYIEGNEVSDMKTINEILKCIPDGFYIKDVSSDGAKNNARPLKVGPQGITVGNGSGDIGRTISDITLKVENLSGVERNVYLSLKFGSVVTLANLGITKILQKNEIQTGKITNASGKALLDFLGIDEEKFCDVFNNYGKDIKTSKAKEIEKIKLHKTFGDFIKQVIGYNYILIHKIGSKTFVENMTYEKLNDIISNPTAEIIYPLDGKAKRVDIKVDMKGIKIKLNIRSKTGDIYPSHLMADYELKH